MSTPYTLSQTIYSRDLKQYRADSKRSLRDMTARKLAALIHLNDLSFRAKGLFIGSALLMITVTTAQSFT